MGMCYIIKKKKTTQNLFYKEKKGEANQDVMGDKTKL